MMGLRIGDTQLLHSLLEETLTKQAEGISIWTDALRSHREKEKTYM
ncbi:MAG: hypothetical protein KatS3mg049_0208 [Caldilinea sp.]|jgi:hypothetical protein|nr:MAG: hypothetical protein KatS3mg049_0208 [Caldilinea sp.]